VLIVYRSRVVPRFARASAWAAQRAGPHSRPVVPDGWGPCLLFIAHGLFLAALGPPRWRRNAPGRIRGLWVPDG
ncbi:MAG: hypothetical protein AAF732_15485, partial [Pseudomonadota bacterium]